MGLRTRGEVLDVSPDGQTARVKLLAGTRKDEIVQAPTKTIGAMAGDYLREHYVAETGKMRQTYRISARVRARDVDYAHFKQELESKVNPIIQQVQQAGRPASRSATRA